MLRRIAITLLVAALPFAVHAATDDQTGGSQLQPTNQSGVSPQSSSLLQPANSSSSPLQSADAGGAGVSQPSNGADLQQTGSSDQTKLFIQGDGEAPQTLDETPNITWLWYIFLTCLAASGLTGLALLLQRRRS